MHWWLYNIYVRYMFKPPVCYAHLRPSTTYLTRTLIHCGDIKPSFICIHVFYEWSNVHRMVFHKSFFS